MTQDSMGKIPSCMRQRGGQVSIIGSGMVDDVAAVTVRDSYLTA
jgi:hypothetical protein